ncbi:MAG: hypothetical protein ACRDO4_04685 [Nocardioides sp.]
MTWLWRWAVSSNEQAVENARQATTALSRGRVEREEVELFLRERYDEPVAVAAPVALDPAAVRTAR